MPIVQLDAKPVLLSTYISQQNAAEPPAISQQPTGALLGMDRYSSVAAKSRACAFDSSYQRLMKL